MTAPKAGEQIALAVGTPGEGLSERGEVDLHDLVGRLGRVAEEVRPVAEHHVGGIDVVEDGDGTLLGEQRTTPMRFSVYWTFVRKPAGQWRLDFMDDDLTWVV